MKKGSISVYLCMVFGILLVLIFACIDSARLTSGKAAVSCALEQGMFSQFSKYDRTIYEKYGLFVMDETNASGELSAGNMADEIGAVCNEILSAQGTGTTPASLYRINIAKKSIDGYILSTDANFEPLREQICEIMKLKLGKDAINVLTDIADGTVSSVEKFSMEDDKDMEALLEDYKEQKNSAAADAGNLLTEIEKDQSGTADQSTGAAANAALPADFENPIEVVSEMKEKETVENVKTDTKSISSGELDKETLVSKRSLNSGMGVLPLQTDGAGEKLLVSEYALDFFPNYVSQNENDEFKYQTEYIIVGGTKDANNYRSVVSRLVLMREGFNYLYLMTDAEKMAQIREVATIVSTALLAVEAEEAVAQLITLCWAYAESIVDVKELVGGGKEPLFKSESTWQTSLLGLSKAEGKSNEKGMSYKDYLRLLMYMTPEEDVMARTADMIEYNKRKSDQQDEFALDSCVTALDMTIGGTVGGHEFSVKGSYAYND